MKRKIATALIILFFFLAIFFFYNEPMWDEAVYISMGKYIFSGGNSGFFEISRPVLIPLVSGTIWKTGVNPLLNLLLGRITCVFFSIGIIIATYTLAKKAFNKNVALFSAVLISTFPIFINNSSKLLTDIPSTFFILVSCNYLIDKKYFLSGVFCSLGFLTRFPHGLMAFVILTSLILTEKSFRKILRSFFEFGFGAIIIALPFFIFNYFSYISSVSKVWHAVFRPLIYAMPFQSIGYSYGSFLFYAFDLLKQNFLIIFSLVALFLYIGKKIYLEKSTVIYLWAIIFFIYYSIIPHKEPRYAISFLPALVIIASVGIIKIINILNERGKAKITRYFLFGLFICIIGINIISGQYNINFFSEKHNGYDITNSAGTIVSTIPFPGIYTDNKINPQFFTLKAAIESYETDNKAQTFILVPEFFSCEETECINQYKENLKKIITQGKIIYFDKFHGNNIIIFSKDVKSDSIDKLNILKELKIPIENYKISMTPQDKKLMVFRLSGAPLVYREDNLGNIWMPEKFQRLNEMLPYATWCIIPKDLKEFNEISISIIKGIIAQKKIEIGIQGYASAENEFSDLNKFKQKELLQKGISEINFALGIEPQIYCQPYNSGNLIHTLLELNFSAYTSNSGDINAGNIARYDSNIDFIDDWKTQKNKNFDELKGWFDHEYIFSDYIIVDIEYFLFTDFDFNTLQKFLDYSGEFEITYSSIKEMKEWFDFRNQVKSKENNGNVSIDFPKSSYSKELTIVFFNDDNIHININEGYFKNGANKELNACINEKCSILKIGEIKKI